MDTQQYIIIRFKIYQYSTMKKTTTNAKIPIYSDRKMHKRPRYFFATSKLIKSDNISWHRRSAFVQQADAFAAEADEPS